MSSLGDIETPQLGNLCVQDMFILASMGPPGGGRTNISQRLQSRFNLINMTFPHVRARTCPFLPLYDISSTTRRRSLRIQAVISVCLQESQIRRIFSTMINQKLEDFKEDVKPIGDILTQATLKLYSAVSAYFLPTPAKIHYLFNLRDISKV